MNRSSTKLIPVCFIYSQICSRNKILYDDDLEKKESNLDDVSSYSEADEIVVTTSPLIPVPVRESSPQVAGVAQRADMQQRVADRYTSRQRPQQTIDGRSRRSTRPLSCSCVLDIPAPLGLSTQLFIGDEKAGIVCSPFLEHSVTNSYHGLGDRKLSSTSTTDTASSLLSIRSRTYTIDWFFT